MKILETTISDVKILKPKIFGDHRGFFMETFREKWFRQEVADVKFVQDNHSKSCRGILRGLHFQTKQTQGKLVRVTHGEVYDVAVDIRRNSPTFGMHVGILLSAENKLQLWIPEGFAHGFYVTSESAEFVYKCTNYYFPEYENTLLWNDSDLDIQWPLKEDEFPVLSEKDINGIPLVDITGL